MSSSRYPVLACHDSDESNYMLACYTVVFINPPNSCARPVVEAQVLALQTRKAVAEKCHEVTSGKRCNYEDKK